MVFSPAYHYEDHALPDENDAPFDTAGLPLRPPNTADEKR
jgi:hypothetical protein